MPNKRNNASVTQSIDHVAEIKALATSYRQLKEGYRDNLYDILEDAAKIIRAAIRNKNVRNRLSEHQIIDMNSKASVSTQIMYAVESAKTQKKKKRAQKHARAITYLMDAEGCKPKSIAGALRQHGGIEKVLTLVSGAKKMADGDSDAATSELLQVDTHNHRYDKWPKLSLRVKPIHYSSLSEANDNISFKLIGHLRNGCFIATKAVPLKREA